MYIYIIWFYISFSDIFLFREENPNYDAKLFCARTLYFVRTVSASQHNQHIQNMVKVLKDV